MKTAPPTLPGIPAANSKPLKPASHAASDVSIILAPASAVTVASSWLATISSILVRIKTRPEIPPSLIIKLEAFPITVKGRLLVLTVSTKIFNSSKFLGKARYCAGPPVLVNVKRLNGIFS